MSAAGNENLPDTGNGEKDTADSWLQEMPVPLAETAKPWALGFDSAEDRLFCGIGVKQNGPLIRLGVYSAP